MKLAAEYTSIQLPVPAAAVAAGPVSGMPLAESVNLKVPVTVHWQLVRRRRRACTSLHARCSLPVAAARGALAGILVSREFGFSLDSR